MHIITNPLTIPNLITAKALVAMGVTKSDLDGFVVTTSILGPEISLATDYVGMYMKTVQTEMEMSGFLSKPATSNGTLNIGAGSKPITGAYNIDINPSATGVYTGNATNLSEIASGSQSRIVMQNPYNYNALNPEVNRVLQNGGTIEISGGMSNKWFNSIYKMSESELNSLGYSTVSRGQATSAGTGFTTQGEAIKSNIMEIILKKIK